MAFHCRRGGLVGCDRAAGRYCLPPRADFLTARTAETSLERTQRVLAQDPANGSALGHGAVALAALGDEERAKDWIKRALLMDPDNFTMRWNLTCALSRFLGDKNAAIDLLATFLDRAPPSLVAYVRHDTDLDPLRDEPRFEKLVMAAEKRVQSEKMTAA